MIVSIEASAEAELEEAWTYYGSVRAALADRFVERYDETIRLIAKSPRRFAQLLDRPEIRRARLDPFSYVLIFQIFEDRIVILAVKHDARSDDFWRRRVEP